MYTLDHLIRPRWRTLYSVLGDFLENINNFAKHNCSRYTNDTYARWQVWRIILLYRPTKEII